MSGVEVTVRLSQSLAQMAGGVRSYAARGDTVGAALTSFAEAEPVFAPHIFDEAGKVRRYIVIVHCGDYVRGRAALDRPLSAGDEVFIVTAVTGG